MFGHTWDEPEHLAAGLAFVDTGEYPYDTQHPPIARIAMAIGPYLAGARAYGTPGPSGEHEGREILYNDGRYDQYLTLARVGMLPFLVLLLVATGLWARRVYGSAAALTSIALVMTTPTLIGHAAVAALDVPMAATTMLALYLLLRWFDAPSMMRAVCFGLAAGMAAATKLSAIPFLGGVAAVWAAAWLVNIRAAPLSSPARPLIYLLHALTAAAVAIVILIFSYGFSSAPLAGIPVPIGIPRIIEALTALDMHNSAGHLSFFMGELRRSGWWNFYLVALSLKTPLPLLLLGIAGLCWLSFRAWHQQRWVLAAPSLAF
ncbi:MAG: phospholipid carrier-dependent glycosyltransferase, partial [Candidatus Obscuribacterales bacterium]|nr:phospholipid carrier-dependent glycosyltransferase [Steroidobacteraceae bacterium]